MSEGILDVGLDGFTLPVDAAAARIVTLGKSGAGKTNSDAVLIEEFVRAGVPTIVLDPLGNMRGLRSSADGNGEGISIAIFGGSHGDVPLRVDRAGYLADLAAEGVSCVFDLSLIPPDEHVEFAKAFLPRLLQRAQTNLHVVLEEADRFAPQRAVSSPVTMFSRALRNAGIGWTFSTQKPQVLHKEVIDSASVFIAMKMTGELAQDAIGGEIGSRIGKKSAARMIGDLPSFKRGEAWFVPDPDWLGVDAPEWEATRMRFRLRSTFEVRPPRVGEQRREPKILAAVDLERLRETLSEDEDYPEDQSEEVIALRDRVAELEDMVAARSAPSVESDEDFVWLGDGTEMRRRCIREKLAFADRQYAIATTLEDSVREALARASEINSGAGTVPVMHWGERFVHDRELIELLDERSGKRLEIPPGDPAEGATPESRSERVTAKKRSQESAPLNAGDVSATALPRSQPRGDLSKGATALLDVIVARHPMKLTLRQVATMSGRSIRSSQFRPNLGELVTAGLVDRVGGHVKLTVAGMKLPGVGKASKPADLRASWLGALPAASGRMLRALLEAFPLSLDRDDLCARAGISPTSSTVGASLRDLRENGLVTIDGRSTRASEWLIDKEKR